MRPDCRLTADGISAGGQIPMQRPPMHSSRTGLAGEGLCQPTMESGGKSSGTCPVSASPAGAGGTDTTMVSSATIDASSVPLSYQPGLEVIVHQPQPVLDWLDAQLAVWNISGRDTESRSFRRTLPRSCSSLGEPRPYKAYDSLCSHSSS